MDKAISGGVVNSHIVIDYHMGIVKADEEINTFLGKNAVLPLSKSIFEDDLGRVVSALEKLDDTNAENFAIRMYDRDGVVHWMAVEALKGDVDEIRGQIYDLTISELYTLLKYNMIIKRQYEETLEYFSLMENMFVQYDIKADYMRIFIIADVQQLTLFSGTLAEWKNTKLDSGAVDDECKQDFEGLISAFARGEVSFSRQIKMSVAGRDDVKEWCTFKGKTVLNEDGLRIVHAVICVSGNSPSSHQASSTYVSDMRDPGTDLLNKKAITNYTRRLIASQPDFSVTIAVIDIDDFKMINDTYGHLFGDRVLLDVANILKDAVGKKGLCGRIGGDEMFIVMENIEHDDDVRAVLRTVKNNISWLYHDDKSFTGKITCSIGAAKYPHDASDFDSLFKIADRMLYLAKEKGKNRYIIYHDDLHKLYIDGQGMNSIDEKGFYKYRKTGVVTNVIQRYAKADAEEREKLFDMISKAFNIDSIFIYEGDSHQKITLFGPELTHENDRVFIGLDNYAVDFREDGVKVIDNINYFETKSPKLYEAFSSMGISQAVQYIEDGINIKLDRDIISFNRFKQESKWAELDLTYLAILGSVIINDFSQNKKS